MTEAKPREPIALLQHAEKLADERGMPKPEGLLWSLKAVKPDLRSHSDYRWPFPGGWAECREADVKHKNTGPCPETVGDGLCVALTWRGMASGGRPAHVLLLIGYEKADVLGGDENKVRCRKVYVRDVVDGARLAREHGAGANLEGADLHGADLHGANLEGADLEYANLHGADLEYANLSKADLHGANLHGANLHGANLEGADLEYANLEGADLEYANLEGANLEDANLEGANLEDANLEGANLEDANLKGADFEDARWNKYTRGWTAEQTKR